MSAFFRKLFSLFLSKIVKNAVFALRCKISIAEVRLPFYLARKCRSAITELLCALTSSVRRILKRGGGGGAETLENLRRTKFWIRNWPKLGEEQKKKGLHSKLVRFFAQIWVLSRKKRTEHALCVIKPYAQLPKGGGGHASILPTFLCNFAILANQRGGGPWHNAPPKYAPGSSWIKKFIAEVALRFRNEKN